MIFTTTFFGLFLAGFIHEIPQVFSHAKQVLIVLTATYQFDSNSNRTSKFSPVRSASGTLDAQDRMSTYGGCSFLYTARGNDAQNLRQRRHRDLFNKQGQ